MKNKQTKHKLKPKPKQTEETPTHTITLKRVLFKEMIELPDKPGDCSCKYLDASNPDYLLTHVNPDDPSAGVNIISIKDPTQIALIRENNIKEYLLERLPIVEEKPDEQDDMGKGTETAVKVVGRENKEGRRVAGGDVEDRAGQQTKGAGERE